MAFDVGYSTNEALLMLNFCNFSYLDSTSLPGETIANQETRMRGHINSALAGLGAGDWQVAWGPALSGDQANMLYVAQSAATNQLAVVIRGTVPTFVLDWAENLGVILPLQQFTSLLPGHAGGDPRIAPGTRLGLGQIQSLQGATQDGGQSDLITFVRTMAGGHDLFFTGHSLGGCLASVLAPTIGFQLGSVANIKIYTFAAPSPGNADFATYYNSVFTDSTTGKSTAYRLFNDLDVVPNAWASLDVIDSYYQPAPLCTDEIKAIVLGARTILGPQYVQLGTEADGSARRLHGTVAPIPLFRIDLPGDEMFFQQLLQQHGTLMYQHLIGPPFVSGTTAKLRAAASSLERRVQATRTPGG